MNPLIIWDVVRFELKRSWTIGRVAIWVVLVMFPIVMFSLLLLVLGWVAWRKKP